MTPHTEIRPFNEFDLWRENGSRPLFAIDLEVTARCNNRCPHCYINLPANDRNAKKEEMPLDMIKKIADEAVSLGVLWVLITGGEPLLRDDFKEIYLYLKQKGFLVSVFTNATLVTEEHIRLFEEYPPRDLEITVYGLTEKIYERVSRVKGSFKKFQRGLDLLRKNGIKTNLKATGLQSNKRELPQIINFCRKKSAREFRFDPHLHLRFDGDPKRNGEIIKERLTPQDIMEIERIDPIRFEKLKNECSKLITEDAASTIDPSKQIFYCGVGLNDCSIGYNGFFRLCPSLFHPYFLYDLKKGSLADAWLKFTPDVLSNHSFLNEKQPECSMCSLKNICMWCPANAYLESGNLCDKVDYFCQIAQKRKKVLR